MNEVTHIHLGRQSYTISVEAHNELQKYLSDIQKRVADQEVASEVELRMSELLLERGVSDKKVVLPADVDYLKKQLGDPDDFSDGDEVDEATKPEDKTTKRLFRDTDNALIAGVAAGLASYTGLDAVLIRLLFIVLIIFSAGVGIVIYILLWLVVPPAETASEKLQMCGKPVTLEALKDSVSKADVGGAAQRVNNTIVPVINNLFKICIKLAGIGFVVAGLAMLVADAIVRMYMSLHNGRLFQENLFPVGAREEWLLGLVMIAVAMLALFLILFGISAFKRKWPIHSWITGILVGIFVIVLAGSFALAADTVPHVRDRYEATLHTTAMHNIQPFDHVATNGSIDITYVSSPDYAVNLHYSGNPDLSKVKVRVANNTLYIDSRQLDNTDHCTMLCLFPRYDMTVQIYAPNVSNFKTPPNTDIFYPKVPPPPSLP